MSLRMLRCPRCGHAATRRSARSGLGDHVASLVGRYPFRCRLCQARFRAVHRDVPGTPGAARRRLRPQPPLVVTALIGLGVILLVLLLMQRGGPAVPP